MKPCNNPLLIPLAAAALAFVSTTHAATYYWDSNGDTAGFGNDSGTWGSSALWTTVSSGGATHSTVTTTTADDDVNFGTSTLNYGNGTVNVDADGVTATSIVFGSGQTTALTIGSASSGTITLGGSTRTIIANSSGHSILAPIALTGATTVRLAYAPPTAAVTSLTLGALSGIGGVTFENTAGGNPTPARFTLNGASSYSGNTVLQSTVTNASVELRLGIANALPTSTVLNLQGANGTGSGRTTSLNLNGYNQTLGGLSNSGGGSSRTFRVFSSSAATLTINDSGNRTFSGLIGDGGTNISIVKQGAGTWTVSGANSYVGTTTISAGTLEVQGSVATSSSITNNAALVFNSGSSQSYGNEISGSGTLTKSGSGALTLAGANTYSGHTFINSGTVILGHDSALGTTASGTTIVGSAFPSTFAGTTLNLGTTALTLSENFNLNSNALGRTRIFNDAAVDHVLNGNIDVTSDTAFSQIHSNSGSITVNGDITGTITNGADFIIRGTSTSANNRLLGSINLTGGNLFKVDSGTWLVGAVGETYSWVNTQVAQGTLSLGAANVLPSTSQIIMGQVATSNTPTLDLNGFNQTVVGMVDLTNTSVKTITSSSGTPTLTVGDAGDYTYGANGGVFTGSLALTKTGAGMLTLANNNTYSGNTTVSEGNLTFSGSGRLYNGGGNSATVSVATGTEIVASSATTNNVLGFAAGATWSISGTFNSTGGGAQTLPGTVNLNNGTLTGAANGTFGTFLTHPVYSTTLTANGAGNLISSANFGMPNASPLVLNTPLVTDALSVTSPLGLAAQTGALTKSGLGTVTLSGTNNYTGATTVSAGTLALGAAGSIVASSSITVDAGATLDVSAVTGGWSLGASQTLRGNGLVDGASTINGTLAPGNSIGMLSFGNNLTFNEDSGFAWELTANESGRGTNYDAVNVAGSLGGSDGIFRAVLTSGSFADAFWTSDRSWADIFMNSTEDTSLDFASIFTNFQYFEGSTNVTAGINTYGSFTISGTSLTWTAIPEPSTALAGILLGLGLLRRRR